MLEELFESFLKILNAPSQKEKIDFLEFVYRKIKDGDDFKKIITQYVNNKKTKMRAVALLILEDLNKGIHPALALRNADMVDALGYSVLITSEFNRGIEFVTKNIETKNEVKNAVLSAIWKPIGTYFLIALAIWGMHDYVLALFDSIQSINKSVSTTADVTIPFYLADSLYLTKIGLEFLAIVGAFVWLFRQVYEKDASIIYQIILFRHKVYEDLHSTLQQYLFLLESGTSNLQIYKTLSEYSLNSYFQNLFKESLTNSTKGGIFFDIIKKSAIPQSVTEILQDGEISQKEADYIRKAIVECDRKIKFFAEIYAIWLPFSINILVFAGVGFITLDFFVQVFTQSLLPIMG